MKKLLFIIVIISAILTGCNQTPYDNTIKDHYYSTESHHIVKDGLNYKIIRDYKPLEFKQLDSIPSLNGIQFKQKPEVAVEHTYKCTLVFTICNSIVPNTTEVDTIYLYKNKDGRYAFCEMYESR